MKQTAVDYLIEQLQAPCRGIPSHIIEQAKEMEKQQIIDAAERWKGTNFAEQYYNETYGSKGSDVTSSRTEISDKEIEKGAIEWCLGVDETGCKNTGDDYDIHELPAFIAACKWYREQLK